MEYVQERITTLHDFGAAPPEAPTDRTAVVVPMTDAEYRSETATDTLSALSAVDPARVIVALRTDRERAGAFADWLSGFDLAVETLWCGGPELDGLLDDRGLGGAAGKGRDVWLALGLAARDGAFVVVHDADATTYSPSHVPKLCALLAGDRPSGGFDFVKGYYARVERNRLFGRLCRLFYAPLVRALGDRHDATVLEYLAAFRYALAGEFALTGDLARRVRVSRGWGLEIDVLGAAFEHAGVSGTAQTDLGIHAHDHRDVGGAGGLSRMSHEVGAALLRAVEAHGVAPDYATLPERYERAATTAIRQYAADAAYNGLEYDADDERTQVSAYTEAIAPPGPDTRLPAWADAPLDPDEVRQAAREDLAAADR